MDRRVIFLAFWLVACTDGRPNFGHIDLHHPRQVQRSTRRRLLSSASDLPNYFHHGSRFAVGADLGRRLYPISKCVSECDSLGFACAGFIHERYLLKKVNNNFVPAGGNCTLVGRGYGLRNTAESDFYRKKAEPGSAFWRAYANTFVPSPHLHAWQGYNGTLEEMRAACALDSQCQGFYTCKEGPSLACREALYDMHEEMGLTKTRDGPFATPADAIFLSGVPAQERLLKNTKLTVHSRATATCGGTANGANCMFPFTAEVASPQHGIEYFEPTIMNSDRPFCYTSNPGKWGYADCFGNDPLGVQWDVSEWTECPVSCGGGLKTRTVHCKNTTTGATVVRGMCGAIPKSSKTCNTHSCIAGCELEVENRKPCGAFYEDPRSGFDSPSIRASTCKSYGCCWGAESSRGYQCYKSKDAPEGGCKFGYDGASLPDVSTATSTITQCGDSCCRGDSEHGQCAWSLGYANPQDNSGSACNKYKNAASNNDREQWFYYGPDKYAICEYVKAGQATSNSECKTACKAEAGCNTVNYHEGETICELLNCGQQRSPPMTKEIMGFGVYVWESSYSRKWQVGEWGPCKNSTGKGYSSNEECQFTQTRPIACLDKNDKVRPDQECLDHFIKPESLRTCYGSCGQNRSCEELGWGSQNMQTRSPYRWANDESCGFNGVGGPYEGGYYDHDMEARTVFSGCYREEDKKILVNYSKAHGICSVVGSRLCTLREMEEGTTRKGWGQHCSLDNLAWTSTKCGPNNEGRYVAASDNRLGSHGDTVGYSCVPETQLYFPACCSDWETQDWSAQMKALRKTRDVSLGEYGYCNDDRTPCKAYEGHCRFNGDCQYGTSCAQRAGAKYGLPEGSSVCIPTYFQHQIAFWPPVIYKGQPTNVIFQERGKFKIPDVALVRIIKGNNQGCLGVWDYSVPIAAESTLYKKGSRKMRQVPLDFNRHCSRGPLDQDLPENAQPYLLWENLIIDGQKKIPGSPYVEVRSHVCLCDNSTNCNSPSSWHDLGRLAIEPTERTFFRNSNQNHPLGNIKASIGYGGDLYESYRMVDMIHFYPDLSRLKFGLSPNSESRNEKGLGSQVNIHMEFCAQRCMANPLCYGFDWFDETEWDYGSTDERGYKQTTCRMRGEGVKIKVLARNDYVGSATPKFYFKTAEKRQYWDWYPSLNYSSGGYADNKVNPTLLLHEASCGTNIHGINKTVLPKLVEVEPTPDATISRLRETLLPAMIEGKHSDNAQYARHAHTGDGKVFFLPRVNAGSNIYSAKSDRPSDAGPKATFFDGGLYVPKLKPTCGGNAKGAPCWSSFNAQFPTDPHDTSLLDFQCHIPKEGGSRKICYTNEELNRWGYCDCDGAGWTRMFGKWEGLMNTAFRGGNILTITDALNGPIDNVFCENKCYDHKLGEGQNKRSCKFGANTDLCIKSEHYREFFPWSLSGSKANSKDNKKLVLSCPEGEVLTGLAVTTLTADQNVPRLHDQYEDGVIPRCGVPAGWSVGPADTSEVFTSINQWRNDNNWENQPGDFIPCPNGKVAVGLKWDGPPYNPDVWTGELRLLCAAVTMTDPTNSGFKRTCKNIECDGSFTDSNVADAAACLSLCSNTGSCMAAESRDGGSVCRMHSGTCTESATPYGRPVKAYHPKETTYGKAVFTPVEYEHPANAADLFSFQPLNVPKDIFLRSDAFKWVGTPWSSCNKACGTGVQNRTVFCAPLSSPVLSKQVDDSYCSWAPKLPSSQYCNMFHCDLQCRKDVGRRACSLYASDNRRNSISVDIRRRACEFYHCCFVADPTPNANREYECYEQPHDEYKEWISLPFGKCSADCIKDTQTVVLPTQSRKNLCAWTNGTAAKASECAYNRPLTIQSCNSQKLCAKCSNVLSNGETCGYGRCEKIYNQGSPWSYGEKCTCLDGYEKADAGSRCVVKTRCYPNATNSQSTGWSVGSWGSCTKAVLPKTGGVKVRTVSCSCVNSLTGDSISCESCYDRCDESSKPKEAETCTFTEPTPPSYALPRQNWTKSPNLPVIDPASDFILLEYRTTSAVMNAFTATSAGCVAACKGTPGCPAVTFSGYASGGECSLVNPNLLQWSPLIRSNTHHLLLRRGFIKSYPQPAWIEAVKNAGATGSWSSALANKILNANEALARQTSTFDENDPFWSWVNSVPQSNTGTTAQDVSLRKSLYSLGFPTHPNVLKHLRYLRNFLASEHDTSEIADIMLAFAFKYRNFKSITNSTSSLVSQIREGEELLRKCTFANLVNGKGQTEMPLYREPNPAPVGALHYLLEKLKSNASVVYPLKDSPWPLLVLLATSHFPTRECDWVWSRYDATADSTNFTDQGRPTKAIDSTWGFYNIAYTKTKVVCKESEWHPEAISRIPEDGGMCGRLAYIIIGNLACRGAPSAMVGQPRHAAGINYQRNLAGKWEMQKFAW